MIKKTYVNISNIKNMITATDEEKIDSKKSEGENLNESSTR